MIGRPFLSAIAVCHQVAAVSAALRSCCAEHRAADTSAPFPCAPGRSAASVLFVSQSLNARALPIFAALMLATFPDFAALNVETSGSASKLCFTPCPPAASLPKAVVGRPRARRQSADLSPRLPVFFGYRDVSPGRGRVGCAPLLLRRASRGRPDRSLSLRSRSLGSFRALRYARHGGKSLARAPQGRSCNSAKIRCAHVGRVRLCPRAWLHSVPFSRLTPKSGSRQGSRSALSR